MGLHRLDHHSSSADGGVLFDSLCRAAKHRRRHVLASSCWYGAYARLWLLGRIWQSRQCVVGFRPGYVRLVLHPLRDLRWRSRQDRRQRKYVAASFKTMRFIVTVGWSIYPLGYFFGYLLG